MLDIWEISSMSFSLSLSLSLPLVAVSLSPTQNLSVFSIHLISKVDTSISNGSYDGSVNYILLLILSDIIYY